MPLAEAARKIPGNPSTMTLWRWCVKGHRGVKLHHVRLGRKIMVTPAALDEFASALARLDRRRPSSPRRRSASNVSYRNPRRARLRRAEVAELEADEEGL